MGIRRVIWYSMEAAGQGCDIRLHAALLMCLPYLAGTD